MFLFDFETTQNTRYSEKATIRVPNLVCVQQFCSKYEHMEDIQQHFLQGGKRNHSFWDDPVGDLLSYLCEPRPWVSKIIAIAHNAKAFELHLILNRAIFLKWHPELFMNGLKIIFLKMENLVFLDSVSFLSCSLRTLPEAFGLTASKLWYPNYFSTKENLNYVGQLQTSRYMV